MELYEIKQGRARGYLSLTVLQELSPRHGTKRIGNIVETRQATCFRNNLYFSQKFPAMRQSYLIYYIEKVISSSFSIILRSSISTFAICTGAKKKYKTWFTTQQTEHIIAILPESVRNWTFEVFRWKWLYFKSSVWSTPSLFLNFFISSFE